MDPHTDTQRHADTHRRRQTQTQDLSSRLRCASASCSSFACDRVVGMHRAIAVSEAGQKSGYVNVYSDTRSEQIQKYPSLGLRPQRTNRAASASSSNNANTSDSSVHHLSPKVSRVRGCPKVGNGEAHRSLTPGLRALLPVVARRLGCIGCLECVWPTAIIITISLSIETAHLNYLIIDIKVRTTFPPPFS